MLGNSTIFAETADSENNIDSKFDQLEENLLTHDQLDADRSMLSMNLAFFALAISLVVSGIAGMQSYKNTKEIKEFIKHTEDDTQKLVTITRYLEEANSEFRNKNYENAKYILERVLEIDPDNEAALNDAGVAASKIKKFDEAIKYHKKSLEKKS